ncbi:MAG: response regulator [Anaerolineales bacterium]|nr:response regulator [Anaerolineales bacterium]
MSDENDSPLAIIIEDDPAQLNIFAHAVEMAGFTSEKIDNGAKALERLKEVQPSLVILDLHLPNVSGDEILRRIRADERLASVSVILATADPLFAESLSDESDLILLKPVSFVQLRDLAIRLKPSN